MGIRTPKPAKMGKQTSRCRAHGSLPQPARYRQQHPAELLEGLETVGGSRYHKEQPLNGYLRQNLKRGAKVVDCAAEHLCNEVCVYLPFQVRHESWRFFANLSEENERVTRSIKEQPLTS